MLFRSALHACLKEHATSLPPIRGVIHAAAVLDDGMITGLNPERIRNSLAAKSLGALNLHQATLDCDLDFFVLFSSATTPFGNPGQACYVAANCMLESLAAWRASRQLPAQVIGWGPIDDVGMLTRNPKARKMLFQVLGVNPAHSHDALGWLEHCIAGDVRASHYFGLDWQSRGGLPALAAPRFSLLRPRQADSQKQEAISLEYLRSCPPKEARELLVDMLISEVAHVLRMPRERLAADTPLAGHGMDSLMAMELALAIEQKFELTGYTLPFSDKSTARTLADSLLSVLIGEKSDSASADAADADMQNLLDKHGVKLAKEQQRAVRKMPKEKEGAGAG